MASHADDSANPPQVLSVADDALQSGAQRVQATLLSSQRNMNLLLAQSAVQVLRPCAARAEAACTASLRAREGYNARLAIATSAVSSVGRWCLGQEGPRG